MGGRLSIVAYKATGSNSSPAARTALHGIRIFDYVASVLHAKILLIDGTWTVVGSTNFDNRSFGLSDEVNPAVCDRRLAARLEQDFAKDVADAGEARLEELRSRSLLERGPELLGWMLERQQ